MDCLVYRLPLDHDPKLAVPILRDKVIPLLEDVEDLLSAGDLEGGIKLLGNYEDFLYYESPPVPSWDWTAQLGLDYLLDPFSLAKWKDLGNDEIVAKVLSDFVECFKPDFWLRLRSCHGHHHSQ